MFPSDVWLLLDNDQMSFSGAASWLSTTDTTGRWLGNTSRFDGSPGGTITVSFQGLSIAFTGNTPSSSNSNTTFLAGIDLNEPYNCSFPEAGTQFYTQWYQTPTLSDGLHQLNLSEITVDLDYALVTAGESTPFGSGATIVVDNANEEIEYSGSWQESDVQIVPGGGWMSGPPLGNTTHRTRNVGDSFEFKFAGNNIGVYGIFQWNATGSIGVNFTLDGQTTSSSFFVPSGIIPSQSETPHYQFFFANVSSGNHTLGVNITQSLGNQIFVLDYLTYEPSFLSLASKPNFTSSSDSSTSTTTSTSSSTASAMPTGVHQNVNVGAIAGGIVGGVVGLAAVLLGLFLIRRRHNKRVEEALTSPTPFGSFGGFDKTQYQNGYPQTSPTFLSPATGSTSPSITGSSSASYSPMSPGDIKSSGNFSGAGLASVSDGTNGVFRPLRFGETAPMTASSINQGQLPSQSQSLPSSTSFGADAGASTQGQIDELRRRIDDLARTSDAPPAYT